MTCADPSCHRFRFLRSHVGLDRFEKVKRFGLEFDLVPDDRPVVIAQRAQRQRMRLDREHRAILAELLELKSSATTVAVPLAFAAGDTVGKSVQIAIAVLACEFVQQVIEFGIARASRIV